MTAFQRVALSDHEVLDTLFVSKIDAFPDPRGKVTVSATALILHHGSPSRIEKQRQEMVFFGQGFEEGHLTVVSETYAKRWLEDTPLDGEPEDWKVVQVTNCETLLIETMTQLSLDSRVSSDLQSHYRNMQSEIIELAGDSNVSEAVMKILKSLIRAEFGGYTTR